MSRTPYLRSRQRRGRWFHYYRRKVRGEWSETSLGVHGLHPTDPRVLAAWAAEHHRWQERPPDTPTPGRGTLAWGLDLYVANAPHWRDKLSETTRKNRAPIFDHYRKAEGDRPLALILHDELDRHFYTMGGNAAVNHAKALRPVFAYLKRMGIIATDPMAGIEVERPPTVGHVPATADDLIAFKGRWAVGTVERLTFDLGLYTGAARVDLARLGPRNLSGELLTYRRSKSKVTAEVPMTPELRAVLAPLPDIAPAFILTRKGKPYTTESLGNLFRDAASEAGMAARLHGLRKAFCIYWAERGATAHQIAAMAGHITLGEVERYTRAADRKAIVRALLGAA